MQTRREPSLIGIIYASRESDQLYPITKVVPRGILPVFDKPLIYYPLSILMLAGVRDVVLISSSDDHQVFERLLGDGSEFGIKLHFLTQESSKSPGQCILTARDFVAGHRVVFILADCLIWGDGLEDVLTNAARWVEGATGFAHPVNRPARCAMVELDDQGAPVSQAQNATGSNARLALTDLCFFPTDVTEVASELQASMPQGFTMGDIQQWYLSRSRLQITRLGRGFAWLDTATHAGLRAATNLVEVIESTQGMKIGCLEEIAYRRGLLSREDVLRAASRMNSSYGAYLRRVGQHG